MSEKKDENIQIDLTKVLRSGWKYLPYLLVLGIFYLAYYIRTIPLKNIPYLQALDPYQISRMSASQIMNGAVPVVDFLRSAPFGAETISNFFAGESYIPNILFNTIGSLFSIDFLTWTQIYPAIAGALMVIAAFFIGKEMVDNWTGVFSAFFLSTIAAIFQRSAAGWFEKEATAGFLILFSIYFLVRAWKRNSWGSGILAGLFTGLGYASWGGVQLLFYLYPLTAVIILLLNEDLERLLVAFTPTLLVGVSFMMIFHMLPPTSSIVLIQFVALVPLWIRYLAEKYSWVKKEQLKRIGWIFFAVLALILLFAPLFSPAIAEKTGDVISTVLQNRESGSVIGNTVAENSPASSEQITAQLGVLGYRSSGQLFSSFSEYFSPWTWSLVGLVFLGTQVLIMLFRKFKNIEVSERAFYPVLLLISIFTPFIIIRLFQNFSGSYFSVVFVPFLAISIVGSIVFMVFGKKEGFKGEWYYIFFFLWLAATIYGATQKTRIIFLTAQPVAFIAGYGLSVFLKALKETNLFDRVAGLISRSVGGIPKSTLRTGAFSIIVLLILWPVWSVNTSNAEFAANQIGGSPNQPWLENLEFMRDNTPSDSIILSWWDYGYWFETIGQRAALADGGNAAHYVNEERNISMVNFDLADFFTSNNYTEWLPWLKARGVDYVVLDYTMIGKYSAVSQIHNRDNSQYSVMQTIEFDQVVNQGNQTFISYCFKSGGRCALGSAKLFVPASVQGSSMSVTGAPILQDPNGGVLRFNKFCTPNGIVNFDVGDPVLPGCPHIDPLLVTQRLVLTSLNQHGQFQNTDVEATLVKLYLRDGNEMPEFEKVFDNRFVKMWKINYPSWVDERLDELRS